MNQPWPPWRRNFDAARDPYAGRNALGITGILVYEAPQDGNAYERKDGTWVLAGAGSQPLDADLTSIAGYNGTGTWLYRSAGNTWSAVTFGTGITFSGGALSVTPGAFGDVFAAGNNTFTGQNYFNLGSNLPLVIGHTARIDTTAALEIHSGAGRIYDYNWENNANLTGLTFRKSRGGTPGVNGLVANNDGGQISFQGNDGTQFIGFAAIGGSVDGTPSAGVMPGKLQFFTRGTSGGNTVRMTIANTGNVSMGASEAAANALFTATGCALRGVTDGSDAATGWVGQYKIADVAAGSAVALTSGVAANIASLSLEAGDWDIALQAWFSGGSTTNATNLSVGISTTSATVEVGRDRQGALHCPASGLVGFSASNPVATIPMRRLSIAATTTVYFVALATFTVSTLSAYGAMTARRRR